MPSRLATVIVICLLVVTAGEGFAISSLYTTNSSYASEISSLRAQVSRLEGSAYPMAVSDDLNRTVIIAHEPQRIVSLEPSNTQIVFVIGEGRKVVGATTYDDWPSALADSISSGKVVPVGGVLSRTINLETIVGLKPDLVLAWGVGNEQSQIIQQLASAGIPVLVLAPRNMDMIYNDVLIVGRALNAYQNASKVVKDMRSVVDFVSARISGSPRPRVFYEVWNNPLMTAGPSSFVGELIDLAGGSNIFSGVAEQFPTVSAEAVVSLDPQVIIATNEFNMTANQIASQPGFQGTSAAKEGKIFILTNAGLLQEPGPRLVEGLLVLAGYIHQNTFNKISVAVLSDSTGNFNDTALSQFQ